MSRDDLENVAASVRQRLLNQARERDEEYQLLLERYVQERFLHRLAQSSEESSFVLKGAVLFIAWQGERHRVTRDLDLLGHGDPTAARLEERLRAVCRAEVATDGVAFDPGAIEAQPIREAQEYEGLRAKVEAWVGSARIRLQIDVGFGDATWPEPERTAFPTLLGDFEAPHVRMYPRASVVAEKFQAMVDLGLANSRMKDFYDVWFLSERFRFEGEDLAEALRRTFDRRGTSLPAGPPLALTETFADDERKQRQWDAFMRRGRLQAAEERSLEEIVRAIRPFLMRPTEAADEGRSFEQVWLAGGPWKALA